MKEQNQSNLVSLTTEFYEQRVEKAKHYAYNERMAEHVGWMCQNNQYLGFKVATDLIGVDWTKVKSVLDIGCGYGDLVKFLREEKGFLGNYTGIDIVPQFIQRAKFIHERDRRNKFIAGNYLNHNWHNEQFEIIISIGALSVNQDQPEPAGAKSRIYAEKIIKRMAEQAELAMSIYFPNQANVGAHQINFNMAYYQPSDIESIIKNACNEKCIGITISSFPDSNNVKAMARVYFN